MSAQGGVASVAAATTADPARVRQVEIVLQQLEALPTLSSVATRLVGLTSSSDGDFDEIVSLLEADPALSSRLLSLCRRAALGVAQSVTSVRRAVVLLGLEAVQSAVLSAQIYEVLGQMPGGEERREPAPGSSGAAVVGFDRVGFWHHAVAVASCAELLAEAYRPLKVRPEEAFTAGLTHDLGKLVFDWVLPKTYAKVVALAEARGAALAPVERQVIGLDHHVVGKRLAEHWGLPHMLQDAMWLHGQPYGALPDVRHRPLVGLVTLADAVARRLHLGWSGSCAEPPAPEALCAEMELDPGKVDAVIPRLHEAVAKRAADLGLGETTSGDLVLRSIAAANGRLARLHRTAQARAAGARQQGRLVEAIARFCGAARRGAGVAETLGEVARSLTELAGPGYVAALYQPREGEAWRLCRFGADGAPAGMEALEPPRSAEGRPLDLSDVGAGGALGGAIGLLTWLSEHLGPGPDLRSLRTVALATGTGPGAVLLHDRDFDPQGGDAPAFSALRACWTSAIMSAAQQEGASRLTEALAETTRTLGETQQQLAEAQSMARLGELTAGAAHELNNPLTVISGRAQLLSVKLNEPSLREHAAQIAGAATRMSDLVTRLHLVARPPTPVVGAVHLTDLVNVVIRVARERYAATRPPAAAVPGVKLVLGSQLATAAGDGKLLTRALVEIVLNAMEAEPATGVEVRVSVTAEDALVIAVKDDGRGMSDRALHHAFDPFFSEKPAGRQTGLGLAIARRLVGLHGGYIRLESRPGKGTLALVTLPGWRLGQTSAPRAA